MVVKHFCESLSETRKLFMWGASPRRGSPARWLTLSWAESETRMERPMIVGGGEDLSPD